MMVPGATTLLTLTFILGFLVGAPIPFTFTDLGGVDPEPDTAGAEPVEEDEEMTLGD
jgi:hypothetical protein